MSIDLGLDDEVTRSTKRIFSGYRRAVEELIEDGGRSDRNPFGSLALLDSATGVSIGQVMAYAGAEPPTEYLACNGAAVSRTTYAALYNAIGVTYGSGDGSTTFDLPDLRGTMIVGAGGMRIAGPNPAPGQTWANDTVEIEAANLPRHRHAPREPCRRTWRDLTRTPTTTETRGRGRRAATRAATRTRLRAAATRTA